MLKDDLVKSLMAISITENIPENKLIQWLEDHYVECEEIFSASLKETLDAGKDTHLQEHYEYQRDFQDRLLDTWRQPITRLDSLIVICTEIGSEINEKYRRGNSKYSAKLNVVTRLHSRALQITNEIAHLLKGGYADGAMARWRSLHETAVILRFVAEADEDLATRFLDYQSVLRLKAAIRYNKHHGDLNFDPIPKEDLDRFISEHQDILKKYDDSFRKPNGWSFKVLGTNAVTFEDIEKFVKMDFLRIQYGFASQYIHSGVDSIGFKLGLSMSKKDILLSGPSNEGLIEPFQCASLSIIHATSALISTSPDADRNIFERLIWQWHESMKEEVVRASDDLQKKGDAFNAAQKPAS